MAARIDGHHDPLKSLKGMDLKHVVSIKDIMEMPPEQRAKLPVAFIKEKFGDHRNYMILAEAIVIEEIEAAEKEKILIEKYCYECVHKRIIVDGKK